MTRRHRSRHLLRRTRRTQDRTTQRADPFGARRDAAGVGRRERSHIAQASAVSNPQRHHAERIKLGESLAPSARIGRPATHQGLRLPPTPRPRRGCAPGCRSPRRHDGSDTASKPSSPPTSAPSTTKNTSPTNESTPSSDRPASATWGAGYMQSRVLFGYE